MHTTMEILPFYRQGNNIKYLMKLVVKNTYCIWIDTERMSRLNPLFKLGNYNSKKNLAPGVIPMGLFILPG
jgi:hypothetical protein